MHTKWTGPAAPAAATTVHGMKTEAASRHDRGNRRRRRLVNPERARPRRADESRRRRPTALASRPRVRTPPSGCDRPPTGSGAARLSLWYAQLTAAAAGPPLARCPGVFYVEKKISSTLVLYTIVLTVIDGLSKMARITCCLTGVLRLYLRFGVGRGGSEGYRNLMSRRVTPSVG